METPVATPPSSKADKIRNHRLQLRSVLDAVGRPCDSTWEALLTCGMVVDHSATVVQLALPESEQAESGILDAVEKLTDAVSSTGNLAAFFKGFGWADADQYFSVLGSCQIMFIDLDHNDLDDRLAIILLAFQMASANEARRVSSPASTCTLLLDPRTYESCAIPVWRTLRLAARLNSILGGCGLTVAPVFSNSKCVLDLCADYLGVPAEFAALDAQALGTGSMLQDDSGLILSNLQGPAVSGSAMSLWILSGLSALQADDVEHLMAKPGILFTIVEQAQPAWHSFPVDKSASVQPAWDFPPRVPLPESGYGAEPSNVRSSADSYPQTLHTYMRFQKAVAAAPPASVTCVTAALARDTGTLPAPPGETMLRAGGRRLEVMPGAEYVVKKATDCDRAHGIFARLLAAAQSQHPDSLYPELCQGATDDAGKMRPMGYVGAHGTSMPDAITIALTARPREALGAIPVVRRLAVISDHVGPHPPWS